MADRTETLIAGLVDGLRPVRPLRTRRGMALAVLALVAGALVMTLGGGVRPDLAAARPDPAFLISSGVFLVLALASAWAVVDMARPYVGSHRTGWGWTALMAGVLPAAAVAWALSEWLRGDAVRLDEGGLACLGYGSAVGLLTGTVLLVWLRRGAPSDPKRAGMLAGVAAGAAGIFAVSLWCPHSDLLHIGIWHGAAVIGMGLAGRLLLPRMIAW